MDYSTVLKKLYGNCEDYVLEVLDSAIYVEDYKHSAESLFIHTGFIFWMHEDKRMSLLYDFSTESVIKQEFYVSDGILPFNGIVFLRANNGHLYNTIKAFLMVKINANDSSKHEILALDNSVYNVDRFNPKKMVVISDNISEKINVENICIEYDSKQDETFPFQRILDTLFYFDGTSFSFYALRVIDDDHNEDEYQNSRVRKSSNSYEGSWAQEIEGMSDDYIGNVFDGDPDAYWNID